MSKIFNVAVPFTGYISIDIDEADYNECGPLTEDIVKEIAWDKALSMGYKEKRDAIDEIIFYATKEEAQLYTIEELGIEVIED